MTREPRYHHRRKKRGTIRRGSCLAIAHNVRPARRKKREQMGVRRRGKRVVSIDKFSACLRQLGRPVDGLSHARAMCHNSCAARQASPAAATALVRNSTQVPRRPALLIIASLLPNNRRRVPSEIRIYMGVRMDYIAPRGPAIVVTLSAACIIMQSPAAAAPRPFGMTPDGKGRTLNGRPAGSSYSDPFQAFHPAGTEAGQGSRPEAALDGCTAFFLRGACASMDVR